MQNPLNLFAYGTLMCEDIFQDVSGAVGKPVPANLEGYRRQGIRHETYPAIIQAPGFRVEGMLYEQISTHAWRRLDQFEGDQYLRIGVTVTTSGGEAKNAQAYLLHPDHIDCLDGSDWHFDDFLKTGKQRFENQYGGYKAFDMDD